MICELCKLVITLGEMDKIVTDDKGKVWHVDCLKKEQDKDVAKAPHERHRSTPT